MDSTTQITTISVNGTLEEAITSAPKHTDKSSWNLYFLPVIMAFLSFVFFRLLQFAVRWYLFGKWTFPTFSYFKIRRFRRSHRSTKNMNSKSLLLVPPNKKWRISNEVVSLFHSALSGFWALYLCTPVDAYIDQLVEHTSLPAKYLVYITFGYLVHDFIDLIINERSARIIEILFHHVVVLTAFLVTHFSASFLYIVVLGLLMEVNSIFLHTRSLMNLYRIQKETTSFKIVALLNLATFVLFRLVVSVALCCWLFYHYFAGVILWYWLVINSLVIYSLFVTNVVLFYRVLAADGLLGDSRARGTGSSSAGDTSMRTRQHDGADENIEEAADDDVSDEEECADGDVETGEIGGRGADQTNNPAANHHGTQN